MTRRPRSWTLHTNTQGGWLLKNVLADAVFKTDSPKFRIITPDVGGGFGMKIFLYRRAGADLLRRPQAGSAGEMGVRAQRGVRLATTHGRDNLTEGELAIDANGKLLALRTRNIANMGAYLSNFAPAISRPMAGTGVLASVYGFQAVYANVIGVFTNTIPVDAYRGAGRPESNYLVERLIDAAAREIGIDRVELRRRNMVRAGGDAAQDAGRQNL